MEASRHRHFLTAVASTSLLVCLLLAATLTIYETTRQAYLSCGFHRTIVLVFHDHVTGLFPAILAGVLLVAFLVALRERLRADGLRLLNLLIAAGVGGTCFALLATAYNRSHFATAWVRRRELWGVELPRALWRGDVWLVNLLLVAGATLLVLLLWWLLHRTVGQRPERARHWWRRLQRPGALILILALFIAPYFAARWLRAAGRDCPSIVLVSIDTLRADHLSCYGYERPTSPRLDRLASEGYLFEWAFSPAPTTPPAHMSLFTSLYPTVHGLAGSGDRLPDQRLTVAEYLRERGCRTYATTDGGFVRREFGFGQGFEKFDDDPKYIAASVPLALRWLDREIGGDSFFLFIHCYDVHSPYTAPSPYAGRFTDVSYAGEFEPTVHRLETIRRRLDEDPNAGHGLSPDEIDYTIARYDEGILYTDAWIGKLLDGLQERGLLESTWVFVLSDHGEEFTEHGSVLHEKLYHTVTRVPLIVRPPGPGVNAAGEGAATGGGLSTGRRLSQIAELTDLLPTILEIAGARPAALVQGQSLLGLMNGTDDDWQDVAFSEVPWFGQRRCITTPQHHLITSLDHGEVEVFRYRDDPLEQGPAGEETVLGPREALLDSVLTWSQQQRELARKQRQPAAEQPLAAEVERQLRALGYVQ